MVEANSAEAAPDTKLCGMCQKSIEVAKFRLHEAACARNNYKCAKCGEIVSKADREQHEEDMHTDKPDITCDLCQEFKSKKADEVASHKKDSCKNRPQPVSAQAHNPMVVPSNINQASANSNGPLTKCQFCPMEFTQAQLNDHVAYCGSKTKECPECFTSVQAWMMASHKDTGECANLVLDRQEADDRRQLEQVMAQSVNPSAAGPSVVSQKPVGVSPSLANNSNVAMGAAGAAAMVAPVGGDAAMDENEREIARILQEEANAIEGGAGAGGFQNMPDAAMMGDGNQAMVDDGVRAPDEQRMQALTGPDAMDMDYQQPGEFEMLHQMSREEQAQMQQRINQGLMGDMRSGITGAASAMGNGIASIFGFGSTAAENPSQQNDPAEQRNPDDQLGLTEDERQLQLAMAASMGQGDAQQPDNQINIAQAPPQSMGDPGLASHQPQSEDQALAAAMAASMGSAMNSDVGQIQARNDLYTQQLADGEDEDAMLARVLAQSQQNL